MGGLDSSGNAILGGGINVALVNSVGGTIEAYDTQGSSYLSIGSVVTNRGMIQAVDGSLDLASNGTFINTGMVQATGSNGELQILGLVSNKSAIQAVSDGTIRVYGGVISGGAIIADTGGSVIMQAGAVVNNATFSGDGTEFLLASGGTLQNDTLTAGQTLTVSGQVKSYLAGNLNNAGIVDILSNNGTLEVDGATSLSGQGTIIVSGEIVGTGTLTNVNNVIQDYGNVSLTFVNLSKGILDISSSGGMSFLANVLNNGIISVQTGSTVSIEGNLGGTGLLTLEQNSSAYLTSATSVQAISLAGGSDQLTIASSVGLLAHIENFISGDQIDIQDFLADKFSYSVGKVTLSNTSGSTLTISLAGNNLVGHLEIKNDGNGGTLLFHT